MSEQINSDNLAKNVGNKAKEILCFKVVIA